MARKPGPALAPETAAEILRDSLTGTAQVTGDGPDTPTRTLDRRVVRRTPGWHAVRLASGRIIQGGDLAPEISIAEAEGRPDFEVITLPDAPADEEALSRHSR